MSRLKGWLQTIYFMILSGNQVAKIRGIRFGKNCQIRTKKFGSEPYLITIGDEFKTAGEVQFVTHDGAVHVIRNLYDNYKEVDSFGTINIGNNVFIGYGSIIMPNTKIGNNVIVGAGSIVKDELSSNSVYAGIPAKYICSIEEYKDKNIKNFSNTKSFNRKKKKEFLLKRYRHLF